MKLGFVSAILPELSLEEVLQFAQQEGFDCVELMCWPMGKAERRYAGVTHIDVDGFDRRARGTVQGTRRRAPACRSAAWVIIPTPWRRTPTRPQSTWRTSKR